MAEAEQPQQPGGAAPGGAGAAETPARQGGAKQQQGAEAAAAGAEQPPPPPQQPPAPAEAPPAEAATAAEPITDEAPPAAGAKPEGKSYVWGTGRRKTSVARVRIRPGSGKFLVNKRQPEEYFNHERDRQVILAPLQATRMLKSWDVWANVRGGGYCGQAGAVMLGLARALAKAVPELETTLREQGLLTRDARMSERKKPGQPGARKRFQFSKR